MGGSMEETDTTQPTVMLPQNQATYGLALPRLAAEGSSCATPWRMAPRRLILR